MRRRKSRDTTGPEIDIIPVMLSVLPVAGVAGLITGLIDMETFDKDGLTSEYWWEGYYKVTAFLVSHFAYSVGFAIALWLG